MTTVAVPRIDIGSLGHGHDLGRGGQGRVTAVSGTLINGRWPAALKTYSHDVVHALDTISLETIVGFPGTLGNDDRDWLYENTAWPAVIAEDRGTVRGFLMRVVPASYYFDFRTQSQRTLQKLADIAFLLNSDRYVNSSGLSVTDRDRLALLENLATTLSRLHHLGVVVGDLSPKNLLFSLKGVPSCFIIDCDAMLVRGRTVLPQVQTPDWEVPPGEPIATTATDSYKFGLLAIRLFARDQSSYDQMAVAMLSAELGRLAAASQHQNPSRRPGPGTWIPGLAAAATATARGSRTRTIVLAAAAVAVIVALAAVAYTLLTSHSPQTGATPGSPPSTSEPKIPTPTVSGSLGTSGPSRLGEWGYITSRATDAAPLTVAELYPAQFLITGSSFVRTTDRADTDCNPALFGTQLQNAAKVYGCSQVVRASYISGSQTMMGTIGVVNLSSANDAAKARNAFGANDFVNPLNGKTGPTRNLTQGTGVVQAEYKGHYLILIWAEFTNLKAPTTAAQRAQLEQFASGLISGSANIALRNRMVSGHPAVTGTPG